MDKGKPLPTGTSSMDVFKHVVKSWFEGDPKSAGEFLSKCDATIVAIVALAYWKGRNHAATIFELMLDEED